ncbi:MAG: hypothetical protein A2Z49_10790, partial [Chloroflexi bacterium RBG_19FT_COMBO_56_12]
MKLSTLDILACPTCHGHLTQTCEVSETSQVSSGLLNCPACQKSYPIENSIPQFIKLDELEGKNQKFAHFYDWFSLIYAPGARLTYNLFGEKGRWRILKHLEPLSGRVLETSIGTGPNLPYFVNHPGV